MWRFMACVAVVCFMGCGGERFELSSLDQLEREQERVAATMDDAAAEELRNAVRVLGMHTAIGEDNPLRKEAKVVAAINGKTAAQVIAAYEAIDETERRRLESQIAAARKAAEELKATNDARLIWLREFDRLYDLAKAENNKAAKANLTLLMLTEGDMRESHGERAAAEWMRDQVQGKSLEEIAALTLPPRE